MRLDLDGYAYVEPVYAYLHQAVLAGRPAFVVISGRDYTGRTSMANCVLDLYRELRATDGRYLVARVEIGHHRDFEWIQQAMAQLQNEVDMAEVSLTDKLIRLLDGIGEVQESIYPQRFQGLARMLSTELAGQRSPYAFGVLFEDLRTASFVNVAQTVFRNTQSIVVFTHRAYEHAQTPAADLLQPELFAEDTHVVELRPLVESQIQSLARGRWEQASPLHCPFDLDGVAEIFRSAPTPIKAVLTRLAKLLDYRLSLVNGQVPWPDNSELGMSREWLVATVTAMNGWR
ncbi:hypothetical protein AB0395_46305 [Streptosporangium sp. NPDC051023]|uniref:hypothetical protein n=1 Tax=Streptosporangium sp. NPDC051023 TaxID=3155410 RepID=UPI00344C940D